MHSFTVDLHLMFLNLRSKFDDSKLITAQFIIQTQCPDRKFKHQHKDTAHTFSYLAELNYNTFKMNFNVAL
jgi:hypothetical protein